MTTRAGAVTLQCQQSQPWSAKCAHPSSPLSPRSRERLQDSILCLLQGSLSQQQTFPITASFLLILPEALPSPRWRKSHCRTWDSWSKLLASHDWFWNACLTVYSISVNEPKTVFGALPPGHADVEISEGVKTGEQTKSKPTVSFLRKNLYLWSQRSRHSSISVTEHTSKHSAKHSCSLNNWRGRRAYRCHCEFALTWATQWHTFLPT